MGVKITYQCDSCGRECTDVSYAVSFRRTDLHTGDLEFFSSDLVLCEECFMREFGGRLLLMEGDWSSVGGDAV